MDEMSSIINYDPRAALAPPEGRPSGYLVQERRPLSVVAAVRLSMAAREPGRLRWLQRLAQRLGV